MKVTVLDETKNINNTNSVYEQVQTFINNTIDNKDVFFSHMVIDGVEIYHDFEFYVEDHLSEIEHIHVEVRTAEEFIQDIISSIQQYVESALPELKQLSDEFYQTSQSSSWGKLHDLFEALQWIHESIMSIDREKARPSDWDEKLVISSSFEPIFPNLLEALEAKDNILIADIITYEIIPLFQRLGQMKSSEDSKRDSSHA